MNNSTLQGCLDFIKHIISTEEWKDEKRCDEILEAMKECKKLEDALGKPIHRKVQTIHGRSEESDEEDVSIDCILKR